MRNSHTTTNSNVRSAAPIVFPVSVAPRLVKDSSTNFLSHLVVLSLEMHGEDDIHAIFSCYAYKRWWGKHVLFN
jgi:hypothetical protein